MLKKTKIITNAPWIVDSTYTISYPDRCTSCNMSTDRPSRATLDNRKEQEYHNWVKYCTFYMEKPGVIKRPLNF